MFARLCLCLGVLLGASCVSEAEEVFDACSPLEEVQIHGLQSWLEHGCYGSWDAESGVLQATKSDGHAQIFINPVLRQSLAKNNAIHPMGSAAVRVMYLPDKKTVWGYALSMKTENGASEGWFWFEHFEHHAEPKTADFGAIGCTGCHSSGADFVQSSWPLR
jgi:hypothetical protein